MYLNCHSYYSLRYGTLALEELVENAKQSHAEVLALTDINNSTAIIDFVRLCKAANIKPIAGIEFRNGDDVLYTGIANNNTGFQELNEFLSEHNIEKKKFPERIGHFQNVQLIYPLNSLNINTFRDNEWVGIQSHELGRLAAVKSQKFFHKTIVWQPITFQSQANFELHRNLRAIDHNILISKLENHHIARVNESFVSASQSFKKYMEFSEMIRNTEKLMHNCSIDFDYHTPKNMQSFTGSRYEDDVLLEKITMDGMKYRYGKDNEIAKKRIKHELALIKNLGFSAYFLITWDIIRYSMSNGIYHVGRGSGANSIVAYCLKITDIDPIDLDLYFERFINPKRTSPPDFDIDYSWKDRNDVQDYIFKRYGYRHTVLLGSMSTFKGKSIYRELGKVHGLPKAEIDELTKNPEHNIQNNHITKQIHELAKLMVDFPNQRSIHAGGILISEKPIHYYTALDMPPKGFQTTQWDMYVAESIGFEKLDILSQRGIGHIKETVDIVQENKGNRIDIHDIPRFKNDPKVKFQLKTAETNGCFYIESPAMRGLLRKLRCDNYLSLVAASSIIRPGVAKSGMMREYIHRFHHPDQFEYIHPVMEEQLKETYGVMVYQEDVLKICHHFAGLDLADSDVLRRLMSGKQRKREEYHRIVQKFFQNCKQRAYPDEITKEVWRQIESFAGYSFSKAHSASYAVESFQSLYLKAHYPLEFMTAVINNFGGFYHTWVYFNEARRQGAQIMHPCVNHSQYKTRIIGDRIYIGFIHLAKLESSIAQRIQLERERNGAFESLDDFVSRIPLGIEQLVLLIRVSAFGFTKKSKSSLLWAAHVLLNKEIKHRSPLLFRTERKVFKLPQLEYGQIEDAYDEMEIIGFPLSLTQFDMLETSFRGNIQAKEMQENTGKIVRMMGRLVCIKYVKTVRKDWMNFGTFTDHSGNFFDSVHFGPSLAKYPFRGYGIYLLKGKIVEEFGYATIEVTHMAKMPLKKDPRIE